MEAHAPVNGDGLDVNLRLFVFPGDLSPDSRGEVGALLGRDREVDAKGEVVAVIEGRVVVVVDVFRKYVLAFFRYDLEEHFTAEARYPKLVTLGVDGRLCRVLGLPRATFQSPFPLRPAGGAAP